MTLASTIIAIVSLFVATLSAKLAARRAVPFLFARVPVPGNWSGRLSFGINAAVFALVGILVFSGLHSAWSALTEKTRPANPAKPAPTGKSATPAAPRNSSLPIPRPTIRVGDEYVYRNWYATQPAQAWENEWKVLAVGDRVLMSSRSMKGPSLGTRTLHLTPEWNLLGWRDPDERGVDYSPALAYYAFPLDPGKRWQVTSTRTDTAGETSETQAVYGKVAGWEWVTVPAGTFRALKVIVKIRVVNQLSGEVDTSNDTSWYVPEVRRSVKSTIIEKNKVRREIEMLRYKLSNE